MSSEIVRLQPADLFDLRYVRDARFSPDGARIAYVVSRTDDRERFDIWIAAAAGGEAQRLPFDGNALAPRWSPCGDRLAFVGDGRVRLLDTASLCVSEPLTDDGVTVQGAPSWAPDGRRIAVCLLAVRKVRGARHVTERVFRADGLGFLEPSQQAVHVVDCETGAVRRLTGDDMHASRPQWSPCGRRILFFAARNASRAAMYTMRLLTVEPDTGALHEVLGAGWFLGAARWLPDGEQILVTGSSDRTMLVPSLAVWVVNLDGGAVNRTAGLDIAVGFLMVHDMPVWDLALDNSLTVLDRDSAFVTVQAGGSAEVWRIALAGPVAARRVVTGARSCAVLDSNGVAASLLFVATDLHAPVELHRAALDGSGECRLTRLNDTILARWPKMRVVPLSFTSEDGLPIEAWFVGPATQSAAVPTVLYVHGGPFSAVGHGFHFDFLLLASHGIGVVFANFRGSFGYGDAFIRAIYGDMAERAFPDHLGTVDAAVADGLADPTRLGIWGPSHGGFTTCWVVGHTDRFKAAMAEATFVNLVTAYYLGDLPDLRARMCGGRPDEVPEIYRAQSPLTYAHRCTTPTLLVHGEDDHRCPIAEAEQFHRALLDAGCTTGLVRIPSCSHMGDTIGPLEARQAQNQALLDWFGRYLA